MNVSFFNKQNGIVNKNIEYEKTKNRTFADSFTFTKKILNRKAPVLCSENNETTLFLVLKNEPNFNEKQLGIIPKERLLVTNFFVSSYC